MQDNTRQPGTLSPRTRAKIPFWWWSVPLLLLATAAGALGLARDLYWIDEVFTPYMSASDIYGPTTLADVLARNAERMWPPLHNLMLVPWGWVFGWSEYASRLMSLYVGLIGVVLLYQLGRVLFSRRVGMFAALPAGNIDFLPALLSRSTRLYHLYYIDDHNFVVILAIIGPVSPATA